ncbi:MAG: hypothetical protein MUF20_07350 [Methylotetracoccus sp.]|jgi:Rho-binding antiterminator|nr:hypothetical protein [Methylotetracoccus sp.]
MNSSYRPIDCTLHDELELRAMRRAFCNLVWRDEQGAVRRCRAVIADIVTRRGEEWLRLDDGAEIRLDRILEVDGLRG